MPITADRLAPFKKRIFIETGTYDGDGVRAALAVGFEEIWSIEIHPDRFRDCSRYFAGNDKVRLLHGDSTKGLFEILDKVMEPATIWLDAHDVCGETWNKDHPLIGELDIIRGTGKKDNIILMDDIWEGNVAITQLGLVERLNAINKDYRIYFIDGQGLQGPPIPKSIMVADPREDR